MDFNLDENSFFLVFPDPAEEGKRTILDKRFRTNENIDIYQTTFGSVTIAGPEDPEDGVAIYRASFTPTGTFNGLNGSAVWIKDNEGNIKRVCVYSTTGNVRIDETPP